MKANKFLESLNDIDEKIIEEASFEEKLPEKKYSFRKFLIPLVGVALLFILIPNIINNVENQEKSVDDLDLSIEDQDLNNEEKPVIDENLPKISIEKFKSQGAGFEGLMAYDIEELINANPWNDQVEISSLPVFKNSLKYNKEYLLANPDIAGMRKRLDETIKLLNIRPKDIEIRDDSTTNQIYGKNEKYEITVDGDLSTKITFKAQGKNFEKYYIEYFSPYKEVYKTAEYISRQCKDILGMEEVIIDINGGSYTFNGDQSFSIGFFDGKGNLEEEIINYNFNYVDYHFYEEDGSSVFIINKRDLSEKIGDYPIISSKEAEKLLIDKKYITNVPEDFPGKDYIEKVELVYKGQYEENLMPYYQFYVELENMKEENGLKTYGIYYVPAVEGKYIDNMEIMDAKFN